MNTETLELVVANLAGKVRRETLNGRTYIVAPLTLITPGVLNGSQGPLYYPLEELEKSYDAWNAMPIVGWHPTVDGVPVSARRPDVLNEFLLGWVFNARVDGRLTAEGWFDEDLVARFDAAKLTGRDQILPRLRSGKTIELSTGLFTENYSVPEGSVVNGREYTHVARDYRPDHLAILPDQTGACSVKDGCGVHVTAVANQQGDADVAASVLERMWDSVVNAVLGQPKSKNTGRYKPLGSGTGRGDVHEAAQSGALTVTDDDLRLGADAARELAEAGNNPASWVEDEDLWEKAKDAARKSGKYDEGSEQFWAVVTSIYKKMGGGVKSDKGDATTNSEEPPADYLPPPETEDMNKAQKVQFLIANCDCWKNKAGTLNGMTDADVDQFYAAVVKSKEDAQVANAVRQKYAPAVKEATGAEPTANSIAQFVVNSTAVANAGKCPECGKMTMNEKTGVCANCGYDPEDAADGGADESEETPSGKKKKMSTNATPSVAEQVKAYMGGLTEKQWLELAPAGIRAGVQNALESDREARHGYVDALVRNISNEDDRKAAAAEYLKMPTKTLKLLAANAKPSQAGAGKPDESEVDQFIRNYYGAQGGPAGVNNGESLSDDEALANPLPRPTINYEELSPIGPGGHRRTA